MSAAVVTESKIGLHDPLQANWRSMAISIDAKTQRYHFQIDRW
jgi:hypothetical protein